MKNGKRVGITALVVLLVLAIVAAEDKYAAGTSEDGNIAYTAGMAFGIAAGVVVVILLGKALKKHYGVDMNRYDERQKLAQGEAYKYGFYTLLILMFVHAFVREVGMMFFESVAGEILLILMGVLVWAFVCMKREAYFSLDMQPKKFWIVYCVLGLVNVGFGIYNISDGDALVENGVLSNSSTNLIVGVFVFLMMALYAAVALTNGADDED